MELMQLEMVLKWSPFHFLRFMQNFFFFIGKPNHGLTSAVSMVKVRKK